MATTQAETAIDAGIPASGRALLADITNDRVWGDATLEYYLGGAEVLGFDTEFQARFEQSYSGGTTDQSFAFVDQTVRGFEMIDSVVAINFARITTEAAARAQADLVITSHNEADDNTEGFFRFPDQSARVGTGAGSADSWSVGVFNSGLGVMTATPEQGGGEYLNWTVIHEIGHGLGLLHPHTSVDGNLPALASVGEELNNERYTVMSYNGASQADTYGHAVTMMALDIAALQQQYGAQTYAAGASTYTLMDAQDGALQLTEGDVQVGRAYYSIWDSGGVDTIAYGGSTSAVLINLNAATLNNAAVADDVAPVLDAFARTSRATDFGTGLRREILNEEYHAGGFFSRVLGETDGDLTGIDGGFSIAHGAVIENATGGDHDDTLLGNAHNNTLTGNDGDDVLVGGGGDDTIDGGAGCDTVAYTGAEADYAITNNEDGSVTVVHSGGGDGSDTLRNVERARFSDGVVNLGADGALPFTEITSNAFLPFGENVLYRNDDGSSSAIDITSIFESGLIIDGTSYTEFYVNTNGNVTFGGSLSRYTPTTIGGGSHDRLIAPYWADVDTRLAGDGTNPGQVSWDFNAERDSIVVTWNDVGYYNRRTDLLSSFQLEIIDRGCNDVEIVFRYADITWTAGEASDGINGLGGITSRAGFSLGETLFELPTSGNEASMLNLETFEGNLGVAGVWQFIVSGGDVQGVGTAEADVYVGTAGDDNYIGGLGNDLIDGLGGDDTLLGSEGDDTVRGGDGNDSLVGGDGTDRVNGGNGDDTLNGGDTNADLRDQFFGGDGNDLIDAGYGNDEIHGGNGDDTVLGGYGVDTISGGDGNDVLTGQVFSDLIFGGEGDDFINGGFGSDRVNGGAGADRFYHLGIRDHGNDWVQDFAGEDGDILLYGGSATRDQFQINEAITIGAGVADVAESFVIYRPTGQILWALVDGAGQDEILMRLGGETVDLMIT